VTAVVVLGPGSRLWNPAGLTATVTEAGHAGVWAVVDGGRTATPVPLRDWRHALYCDYCDHAAELQLTDGQDGDVICRCCARGHFDRPSQWTRPIPRTVIRRLYRQCERLT
jgi:hypothetical protein